MVTEKYCNNDGEKSQCLLMRLSRKIDTGLSTSIRVKWEFAKAFLFYFELSLKRHADLAVV